MFCCFPFLSSSFFFFFKFYSVVLLCLVGFCFACYLHTYPLSLFAIKCICLICGECFFPGIQLKTWNKFRAAIRFDINCYCFELNVYKQRVLHTVIACYFVHFYFEGCFSIPCDWIMFYIAKRAIVNPKCQNGFLQQLCVIFVTLIDWMSWIVQSIYKDFEFECGPEIYYENSFGQRTL